MTTTPSKVTDAMVTRFLSWRLPDEFHPDCFVRFNSQMAKESKSWPTGTNLLSAGQARAMLQHVLGLAPDTRPKPAETQAAPVETSTEQQPSELRDRFAIEAMRGLMAMPRALTFVDDDGMEMDYDVDGASGTLFVHSNHLSQEAYMIADAMLLARKGGAA